MNRFRPFCVVLLNYQSAEDKASTSTGSSLKKYICFFQIHDLLNKVFWLENDVYFFIHHELEQSLANTA